MKKAGSYTLLIDQLRVLDLHLDQMISIIDTYNKVLLNLDIQQVDQVTDQYNSAYLKYSTIQKDLAQALRRVHHHLEAKVIGDTHESVHPSIIDIEEQKQPRLSGLISYLKEDGFEQEVSELSSWRSLLSQKAADMDKKHEKLVNLLLFASSCNNQWLRDMYSLADQDYKQYTAAGKEYKSQVGIGVNEQV